MRIPLVLSLTTLLAACGGTADDPQSVPTPGVSVPAETEATPGDGVEADVVGTFGGDPQLEGGCAWIETFDERLEPQWPEGYEVRFDDPIQLIGPDGEAVAEEGDEIGVNGERIDDAVTICQVGPVFRVTEVITP